VIEVAQGVPLDEPALFVLRTARPAGGSRSTPVRVHLPIASRISRTAAIAETLGLVTYAAANAFLLELHCLARGQVDVRPTLPLVLRPG
jgi:hypothetical protein